jgi:hypothetical protein
MRSIWQKTCALGAMALVIGAITLSATPAQAVNILTNPGFEDDTGVIPPNGWFNFGIGAATPGSPHSGVNKLEQPALVGGGSNFMIQDVPIAPNPGDTISASIWAMTPSSDPMDYDGTSGTGSAFQVNFFDGAFSPLPGTLFTFVYSGGAPTDVYNLFQLSGPIPAGAALARIAVDVTQFGPGPISGTMYWDDATLEVVPEPSSLSLALLAGVATALWMRRRT